MHVEFASHVDHKVSHSSSSGELGLGLAGVVVGAVICSTGVGTAACLGAVGLYGALGMDIGRVVDNFVPASAAGKIISGLDTVRLGPDVKHAARAFTDTIADCDGVPVAEGSEIVMLGPERRPMSRRGDRVECGGQIIEGIKTIGVGGAPSAQGQDIAESKPLANTLLGYAVGFAGLGSALAKKAGWQAASAATEMGLRATGHGDAASVLRAGRAGRFPSQGNITQKLSWVRAMGKGSMGGANIGSGLIP